MMKRVLTILFLLTLCICSSAQDVSAQSEAKRRIEEEISFINNQLKSLTSKQKASTQQLTMIQRKVSARRKMLNDIDAQIRDTENKRVEKQREINRLQKELDTLEMYYNKLILNTYKNRNTKVWFLYILASENIGQGYRRFAYLKNLAGEVNLQGEKIRENQAKLEKEREELDVIKENAAKLKAEREKEYKSLVNEESASKKELKNLSKSEQQYRKDLAAKKKEVDRLNSEIQRILSRTVESQKKDNTQIDYALAGEFAQNKGKLPWPVRQGTITERFGKHNHPVYKNLKMPENNGVTFTTTRGAEVLCIFDGEVSQIIVMPGYNQCVLVQHGTYFTFYCKLGKVNVKSGQKISRGTVIGTLEPETSTSSSLHFQIWNGTAKQNPESWIVSR